MHSLSVDLARVPRFDHRRLASSHELTPFSSLLRGEVHALPHDAPSSHASTAASRRPLLSRSPNPAAPRSAVRPVPVRACILTHATRPCPRHRHRGSRAPPRSCAARTRRSSASRRSPRKRARRRWTARGRARSAHLRAQQEISPQPSRQRRSAVSMRPAATAKIAAATKKSLLEA
ncbi:hypothetical protein CLOP_g25277 [Closterium sp. NIES-67]|nr:hypothetical protein CLOP_g25277 [Closterium sp. NIES-67]